MKNIRWIVTGAAMTGALFFCGCSADVEVDNSKSAEKRKSVEETKNDGKPKAPTAEELLEAGVVSGHDCTLEATITKLMFLLGHGMSPAEVREKMTQSICGEITE